MTDDPVPPRPWSIVMRKIGNGSGFRDWFALVVDADGKRILQFEAGRGAVEPPTPALARFIVDQANLKLHQPTVTDVFGGPSLVPVYDERMDSVITVEPGIEHFDSLPEGDVPAKHAPLYRILP